MIGPRTVGFRPLTLADAPGLFALVVACRAEDGEPNEATFEEFVHSTFHLPTAVLDRDTLAAVAGDGRLVGFGWLFGREGASRSARLWLLGGVHPDHRRRGIGRALLREALARAAVVLAAFPPDLPRQVDVEAMPGQYGRIALLRSEAFEHVRSFSTMRRDIETAPGIDHVALPDGLRAMTWRADLDEPTRQAHNDAFQDHWASEPVGPDRWRHLVSAGPGFLADCSWLAVDAAGEVVGYVLASAPPGRQADQPTAWIGTVGVRRDHRRRGIGEALVGRSLAAMQAAGFRSVGLEVDADNPTGAVALYARLGFREERRQFIYSRSLG